jgi:porphobilinogen synthase
MFPETRLRRLRTSQRIRALVKESSLSANDLVYPLFIDENSTNPIEIKSMPGQFRHPLENVSEEAGTIRDLGIPAVILFGIPKKKDEKGSEAYNPDGIIQKAVEIVKKECNDLLVVTDVCLCEYTSHGHCGIARGQKILNDETLKLLEKTALSHATAGADIVAPSGMIDGMVGAVRGALDEKGFHDTPIMSYSAKYASSFYGPFREASDSSPSFGDRRTHQMDSGNVREALREIELDIGEGADIVMVKPALPYLDVIYQAKQKFNVPLAAFNVSGEYAMIQSAAKNNFIDGRKAMLECLHSIKRAGADIIITYFAKEFAQG